VHLSVSAVQLTCYAVLLRMYSRACTCQVSTTTIAAVTRFGVCTLQLIDPAVVPTRVDTCSCCQTILQPARLQDTTAAPAAFTIVGTGELNVVQSANVNCVTTDNYWKRRGSKVVVFAGRPLYNLYKAQPANWKGETRRCVLLHGRVCWCTAAMLCASLGCRCIWLHESRSCISLTTQADTVHDCSCAGITLQLPNEPDFLGEGRSTTAGFCAGCVPRLTPRDVS
jgi:hypothetical protein